MDEVEHDEPGADEEHAAPACWRCSLDLDRDSVDFLRGFELGAIWTAIDDPSFSEVSSTVHVDNLLMLARMAEATRRSLRALPVGEDPDSEWVEAEFGPVGSA